MERKLVDKINNYSGQGEYLALASIIARKGSSPRNVGTQMLIYPDGSIYGTIGGGNNEAEIIKNALKLIKKGGTKRLSFIMTNIEAAKGGELCGGTIEVFVETIKVD